MWIYEKRLQYPVRITKTCPKTAQLIISQYGGPDGELSASMRYLSQRYTMPLKSVGGLLTDIGTEELAHIVFCQVLFPEKSVGIPFFQQGIFPAFSGHYASLRMRACSIR